ncbi:uncharacterized protein VNE69_07013 [Vairimorpha necatrix]|uniref:Uncharacterized protein n=1 Tax=Vairimorpha necatrix TaxID=6039 RepID=A0AAX4JDB0_9MICR
MTLTSQFELLLKDNVELGEILTLDITENNELNTLIPESNEKLDIERLRFIFEDPRNAEINPELYRSSKNIVLTIKYMSLENNGKLLIKRELEKLNKDDIRPVGNLSRSTILNYTNYLDSLRFNYI